MSSLEPQTTAKARLHTTKGIIDVELWAKETPITSRIFLNNILNQKFNNWHFNRIVPNFITQVDGSINQEPFEDEFNTRIRFNRRGLLGSVNLNQRNSNTGKFFISLKDTPELNNKNTVFGKVVGDSIFNIIKISEGELAEDGETPLYPVKIMKSEVLIPYFDDLLKEEVVTFSEKIPTKKSKKKKPKVKLNYGDEDNEEESTEDVKVKMKSAHELLNDKKLSKEVATVEIPNKEKKENNKEDKKPDTQGEVIQEVGKEKKETKEETPEQIQSQIQSQTQDAKLPFSEEKPQTHQQNVSIIDKERQKYFSKNPSFRISKKSEKELRELETLKMINSFKEKIQTSRPSSNGIEKPSKDENKGMNDDFDNLDDSESDSDIYTHALKFDENEKNKELANEDLLITIDESKEKELKKRRNDDFYRSQTTSSILSKKQKK